MNLSPFALRHRSIVLAATALLAIWGVIAFANAPRREDPEFQVNRCTVVTQWPGAPAEKVERLVTDTIESRIDELEEIETIDSLSTIGLSMIRVETVDGIDDFDDVWDKVRAKVARARQDLPDGCGEPFVNSEFGDTAAMVLALYQIVPEGSEHLRYTPRQLEDFAEALQDRLKLMPAVARVDLYGVQQEVIYLEVDPGKWSQLALTTDQLQALLAQRNIVAPGGTIDTPRDRYLIEPSGDLTAVSEIRRVLVGTRAPSSPGGRDPYLEDLGLEVRRGYVEPPRLMTRVSPEGAETSYPCVVISFTMKGGENIVQLGQETRTVIEEARRTILPADLEVAVVSDQPRVVDAKINEFLDNLFQAVVIVILVAFLMVGLRIAFVMAAAIPLVMVVCLGGLPIFGVQLEQVSLAAFIIALGLLVDCAIEVCDNVHRLLEEGYSRRQAMIEGTGQVAFPVLMSTLTTVFAFLPMLLLPGMQGEYIYSLPVVVSVTLIVSWTLAMTVTALMAYWIMRPTAIKSPLALAATAVARLARRKGQPGEGFRKGYMALCSLCLRFKLVVIAAAVALFVAAAWLPATGRIRQQFFPSANRDQFVVDVYLPDGSSILQADHVCRQVEDLVRKLGRGPDGKPRLKNFVSYVGQGGPRFYLNLDPHAPDASYCQLVVNTVDVQVVRPYVAEIRRAAREGIPERGVKPIAGARVVTRMLDMGPPTDTPIGVRIYGDDPGILRRQAEELMVALRQIDGPVDIHQTWGSSGYQVDVDIDQDQASLTGVTNLSVARTLNAYFSGHRLTTYREGDRQLPVVLRLSSSDRDSIANISRVFVEGARGKVPLDAVADVRADWKPMKIRRRNQQRMMEVRCRVREGMLTDQVLQRFRPAITRVAAALPLGYRLEIGGEDERTVESRRNIAKCMVVSLLAVILCLVVQFNSIAKPLIILVTLPIAVAGSLFGLYWCEMPMGFMANLGMLSLAGVVINDAIVLIEFIDHTIRHKLESGQGLAAEGQRSCGGLTVEAFRECIKRGGAMRILPITLTSLTTIGGLIPLAIFGGPLFEPMAVVIIFGLALATLLTLFVVPALYALLVEWLRVVPVRLAEREAEDSQLPAHEGGSSEPDAGARTAEAGTSASNAGK